MIETPMKDAKGNIMMGADGKPVMKQTPQYNEDGSMKMKTVKTGRKAGILHNVKKEVSDTYRSYQKKEE